MGIREYLISARFITTVGHLTAMLLLYSTVENNIGGSFGDTASTTDKQAAFETSLAALSFGIFCFVFDFCGIFFGTSLFSDTANMMQIFFHFIGGIFLSWLITENWNYSALWPIIISCNLPTALIEIGFILSIYVFRTVVY